jgi:hypothetical protein
MVVGLDPISLDYVIKNQINLDMEEFFNNVNPI